MALKFLGIYPNSPVDESQTIWLDEETGDLLIQSDKATPDEVRACKEVGSIPGHSTEVPDHEAIIRLSAVMLKYIPRANEEKKAVQPPAREALARAKHSAVHLEMRDHYMLDDPGYLAWQQGKRIEQADRSAWWGPWHDHVQEATARGVMVRRLRIVSEPVHDYIRYEYDITFTNTTAGEHVRWLPRRQATSLSLPGTDFWLFDAETALFHHFTGEGQLAEDGREYTKDPPRVKLCGEAFEAAWALATPHEQYEIR
ncbi:DUF6879 family protein [Streptomyces albipurpureus]|nr:DUF6879 family protein [Streptomyces sp. CWNU-1]